MSFRYRALPGLLPGLAAALLLGQAARALPPDRPVPPPAPLSPARALSLRPFNTTPNDPRFGEQLNLPKIGAPAAWDYTTGSEAIVVAVLDGGFDLDHPDLAGKLVPGRDFVDDDFNPSLDPAEAPLAGYGSALAGIVAANTDNAQGIAGLAWHTRIMPVRVITRTDSTINLVGGNPADVTTRLAQAIRWAADPKGDPQRPYRADIVLVGFYLTGLSADQQQVLQDAVDLATSSGSLVVAGVGEPEDRTAPTFPASLPGVVGVGATRMDDKVVSTSASGPSVDVTAPGEAILTTWWEAGQHTYVSGSGTEFAAAHVAGLAALLHSMDPLQPPESLTQLIENNVVDLGNAGRDDEFGYGRIDAAKALQAAPHHLLLTTSQEPALEFDVGPGGAITPPEHTITDANTSALTWEATSQQAWAVLAGPQGNTPSRVRVSINLAAVPLAERCGTKAGTIGVASTRPEAFNPQPVQVLLRFAQPCDTPTITLTPRFSPTPTLTRTPNPTLTPTDTPTISPTPSPTRSATWTPTVTPTPSVTATGTLPTATRTRPVPVTIVVTPHVYLPVVQRPQSATPEAGTTIPAP